MSRKCLRNRQSTKGSTVVLKTKQDFDRSGPERSRFAIKLTWCIWRDCVLSKRQKHTDLRLSIIDVFSRYHWLLPLQTEKGAQVACELFRIYTEHGAQGGPQRIEQARPILLFPLIPKRWKLPVCSYLQSFTHHRNSPVQPHDAGGYSVNYLNDNPTAADGTPLQNFTDLPWPPYLSSMPQNGTFGDHITLQAAFNLNNVPFQVLFKQ